MLDWKGPLTRQGYGKFSRKINGIDCTTHRVSYSLFNGEIPDNKLVCHTCNVRICVKPSHLYLDTPVGNARYATSLGRMGRKGEASHSSKLKEAQVIEIRKIYREGKLSCDKIGKLFGVSGGTIHNIINGKIWTHI